MQNLKKRMASCRFGTTIIDELRLCFTAEPSFLQSMSLITIGERISFDKFSMVRIVGQHFRYLFKVFDDKNNQVGSLYFGQYGDKVAGGSKCKILFYIV